MHKFDFTRISRCVQAVDKAYKLLLEPEQKKRALDVIHAGKEYVEHMVSAQYAPPYLSNTYQLRIALLGFETHFFLPFWSPNR